ncbi:hypothetical protein F5Y01DRAFT_283217 [Xylaria sp. FL0043]|nr:hypothetical protein F5Y01DRAFT_283217 [Xylaria sp. FL0043]
MMKRLRFALVSYGSVFSTHTNTSCCSNSQRNPSPHGIRRPCNFLFRFRQRPIYNTYDQRTKPPLLSTLAFISDFCAHSCSGAINRGPVRHSFMMLFMNEENCDKSSGYRGIQNALNTSPLVAQSVYWTTESANRSLPL